METNLILKSSTNKKHSHLVYMKNTELIDQQTGETINKPIGITSENNGHRHEVLVDANEELTLLPAGKIAHSHDIDSQLVYDETKEIKESDEEVKKNIYKMIDEAETIEQNSLESAKESEDFYSGKQWSENDMRILKGDGRPVVTLNNIAPPIDLLNGFFAQNRTDIRAYPIESSDNSVADVSSQMLKHIFTINNSQTVESEIFKDETVAGKGIFHTYIDYNKNVLGQIVMERMSYRDVLYGPFSKWDLSDCEYMVKVKSIPKTKLMLMYPDKKEEIKNAFNLLESFEQVGVNTRGVNFEVPETIRQLRNDINLYTENVTIKEIWEKNYITVYNVVQMDDGFVDTLNKLTEQEITSLESMGFQVIKRTLFNMRVVVLSGGIIFDKRIEDQDFFPCMPVYAKRDADTGNYYGKVEGVKDCQRLINKLHSQAIEILSKSANYGYYFDGQTFESPAEENKWRATVNSPGFTAKVKDLNKTPQQVSGVRFPSEIVGLQQEATANISQIMNIPRDVMGFSTREVSSVAIVEKRNAAFQSNEYLFDNFNQVKKQVAKNILKLIQKVYTPERIYRIVGRQVETEQDQAEMQRIQDACVRLINTEDINELDLAVEISSDSPTSRSANFSMLLELIKYGMPLPPDVIINASDLPNKDEILGIMQGQAQAAAAAEDKKYQTELDKVALSKQPDGTVPPPNQANFNNAF